VAGVETENGAKRNNPGGVIDGQREIFNLVQGRGGVDGLGLVVLYLPKLTVIF
jgi:hypothetical protein